METLEKFDYCICHCYLVVSIHLCLRYIISNLTIGNYMNAIHTQAKGNTDTKT